MPFKSKAQIAKFRSMVDKGQMTASEFETWLAHTPDIQSLPDRVPGPRAKKKTTKVHKARVVK